MRTPRKTIKLSVARFVLTRNRFWVIDEVISVYLLHLWDLLHKPTIYPHENKNLLIAHLFRL